MRFGARLGPTQGMVLAAVAVNAAVLLASRHFPFIDAVNHLARDVLISQAWAGRPAPTVVVEPALTPYLGLDLLGAGLVSALGAEASLVVLGLVGMVLPVGAYYVLLRTVCAHRCGWALVAALTTFNLFFLSGLLNYTVGTACALLWLAAWYPRRAIASWAVRLLLATGIGLLFLVHLTAPIIALTVVWAEVLLALTGAKLGRRAAEGAASRTAVTAGLATCALLALAFWSAPATAGADQVLEASYATPWSKLKRLLLPWYGFGYTQLGVLALGYLLSAGAFITVHRRALSLDCFLLGSLALLVGYVVTPSSHDVRWLLPAYLLPFAAGRCEPLRSRWVLLVPAAAAVLHAGMVWHHLRRTDRELDAFEAVLARVPVGVRLLPVICCEGKRFAPVNPYRHYAHWHSIRRASRVAGLFTDSPIYDDGKPQPHFAHFRDLRRLPNPGEDWMVSGPTDSAWRAVLREYDYVVQAGRDQRLRAALSRQGALREISRAGEVRLYRVQTDNVP